ncbi:hypothetical protein [Clostridium sp. KNHs214]|uniref:hypothetical protein n=1 Tax=Clostridium sp. KNHs214 TaxID=1540257 RepID=UPI00055559C8|nr:hypothetical protein [Clostridium sp. KNHs214]
MNITERIRTMESFLKELRHYKTILPRNTFKTLRGQALAGDLGGARKGLNKMKQKLCGGDPHANCSSKLKNRKGMEKH